MKRSLLVIAVSCLSVGLPQAASAECKKWVAAITPCEVSPASCQSPTFASERHYFSKAFVTSAQQACVNTYAFGSYAGYLVKAVELDAVSAGCQLDQNNNGTIDPGETNFATILERQNIQREPMCELVPNGPYAWLDDGSGADGKAFTTAQRSKIKKANVQKYGSLQSDAGVPPKLIASEPAMLAYWEAAWYEQDDVHSWLPRGWKPNLANVDHIIPRKDIYGCDCGSNSFANALVISAQANIAMSNDGDHADRVAILNKYTIAP